MYYQAVAATAIAVNGGALTYVISDTNGSIVRGIAANGTAAGMRLYTPYGVPTVNQPGIPTNHGYQSGYTDQAGLVSNGTTAHDTQAGQSTQVGGGGSQRNGGGGTASSGNGGGTPQANPNVGGTNPVAQSTGATNSNTQTQTGGGYSGGAHSDAGGYRATQTSVSTRRLTNYNDDSNIGHAFNARTGSCVNPDDIANSSIDCILWGAKAKKIRNDDPTLKKLTIGGYTLAGLGYVLGGILDFLDLSSGSLLEMVEGYIGLADDLSSAVTYLGYALSQAFTPDSNSIYQTVLGAISFLNAGLSFAYSLLGLLKAGGVVLVWVVLPLINGAVNLAKGLPGLIESVAVKIIRSIIGELWQSAARGLISQGLDQIKQGDYQYHMNIIDWCGQYGNGKCGTPP